MSRSSRFRLASSVRAGALLSVLLLVAGCDSLQVTKYCERGVAVSVSPVASEVGREIFERGGNAFDAAVGMGFVLSVVYPQAGNIGGGGFAVVRDGQTGRVEALDFREQAPLAATEDMYLDEEGDVVENLSTHGALSVGVPGTVAGLHELWKRYGSLPWEELVTIAADLADTGFTVDVRLAEALVNYREELSGFAETGELFFPEGRPPAAGEKLVLSDFAATLRLIAAEGPRAFYTGEIADKLIACMESHNGLIGRDDLREYRAVWREPVSFTFDSLDIFSMSPPSSGGIVLGQVLKLLEPYDFSRYSPGSAEYIHLFCESSRLAFADRSIHLGDPGYYDIPAALLDSEYLAARRQKIALDHAGSSNDIQPGDPTTYEPDQTTHYSVCDNEGNMVAVTTTLNASFGSGLVVAGAGFLLNEMDDFSIKLGHPNLYGLVGAEANKIEPGKRMLSSMSPTLVLKDGRPFLILGSPGGSRIITTVAQAILNFSRFNLSAGETVVQPRFHHQWLPDMIHLEAGAFDVGTKQTLIRYGHHIRERSPFGDLQMIYIGPTGLMTGASDPRGGGAVAGY